MDGSKITTTDLVEKVTIKPTSHLEHASIRERIRLLTPLTGKQFSLASEGE